MPRVGVGETGGVAVTTTGVCVGAAVGPSVGASVGVADARGVDVPVGVGVSVGVLVDVAVEVSVGVAVACDPPLLNAPPAQSDPTMMAMMSTPPPRTASSAPLGGPFPKKRSNTPESVADGSGIGCPA